MCGRCRGLAFVIAVGLLAVGRPGAAQTVTEVPPAPASADSLLAAPRGAWVFVLPVIAYAPETDLALGATAGRSYRFSAMPDSRPSLFMPILLFTTRSQLMAWLVGDVWWGEDAWHLAGLAGYAKFPSLFYGIGDDTDTADEEDVTPGTWRFDATVSRTLWKGLYVGPRVLWEQARILAREDGGQFATGNVPGADGGGLFGLGLTASYDTRDALMYPTRGWFASAGVTRLTDILGGDFVYTQTGVDLRRYVSLGGTRVLAVQAAATSLDHGTPPYSQLVKIGLRGYYETRYLERHGLLAQIELRSVIRGRLGAVVFAGGSELAASRDGLRLDEARYAAGVGLRVRVGPEGPDRAHLRFDYGVGEGDSGFYVNFAEAF